MQSAGQPNQRPAFSNSNSSFGTLFETVLQRLASSARSLALSPVVSDERNAAAATLELIFQCQFCLERRCPVCVAVHLGQVYCLANLVGKDPSGVVKQSVTYAKTNLSNIISFPAVLLPTDVYNVTEVIFLIDFEGK